MKVLKYLFGTLGGLLVGVAFFLPWANATFAPRGISGRDFTLGYGATSTQLPTMVGESAASILIRGDGWLWVILGVGVLALMGTLFSLIRLQKASIVTGVTLIMSGIVGMAFLYLRAADFLVQIGSTSSVMLSARALFQGFSPTTGVAMSAGICLYLVLTGLFLMLIGGIFSFAPSSQPIVATTSITTQPSPPEEPKALTPSPFPVQQGPSPSLLSRDTVPDALITVPDDPTDHYDSVPTKERNENPRTIIDSRPAKLNINASSTTEIPATDVYDQQSQAKTFAWLIVRKAAGLAAGRSFTISSNKFTIGRGAKNMLALPDTSVSTAHAEIRQEEKGFFVYDLGSSNGTYLFDRSLNDWRKVDQISLRDGDQIKFGRSTFSFVDVNNQSK